MCRNEDGKYEERKEDITSVTPERHVGIEDIMVPCLHLNALHLRLGRVCCLTVGYTHRKKVRSGKLK